MTLAGVDVKTQVGREVVGAPPPGAVTNEMGPCKEGVLWRLYTQKWLVPSVRVFVQVRENEGFLSLPGICPCQNVP